MRKNKIWLMILLALMLSSAALAGSNVINRSGKPLKTSFPSIKAYLNPKSLRLRSSSAMIFDQNTKEVLYARNADRPKPIASITKLMTAMIILDADLDLDKNLKIVSADKDRLRYSKSRLRVGTVLSRGELLELALMASENRAAFALARTYPGGKLAFVRDMNKKAKSIGMRNSRFVGPTGLDNKNVATARDLIKMVDAAYQYALIREYSTQASSFVFTKSKIMRLRNTNRLIRKDYWTIGLSKTGYLNDAGYCLVMQAHISHRPVYIVLLNSWGKLSKFGDANRIRKWLLKAEYKLEKALLRAASASYTR